MDDIGKVLHDRIKADFEKRIEADRSIAAIMKKIGSGKADLNDTARYSVRLGELIKASILDCILPSDLPQEKMYYNIAKSILEPLLHDNYDRINAVCADVQRSLDKKIGINLKPFEVDYPDERIRSALNGVVAKETAVESVDVLGRTAKNITASANDDFVEKNAEYRSKAGLDVFIERRDDGNCCLWCSKLAGRYRYPEDIPEDVFKRHDNCGCLVSYENTRGGGRQNVHTKRDWSDEDQRVYLRLLDQQKKIEREKRLALGKSYKGPVRLNPKQAKEREKNILERIKERYRKALTNGGNGGIINTKRKSGEREAKTNISENSQKYLEQLKEYGDFIRGKKTDFTMRELAEMSSVTGVEFGKIVIGDESILTRGNNEGTFFSKKILEEAFSNNGVFKYHSHPYNDDLTPSQSDKDLLKMFDERFGQKTSKIIAPNNKYSLYSDDGVAFIESLEADNSIDDEYADILRNIFGGDKNDNN